MNPLMAQLLCSDSRNVLGLGKRYNTMKIVPNERLLRIALLVFSICFGLLSICLIVLGSVYIKELEWPQHYVGLDFLELPTLIIILGSLSFLLSIVGCICAKSYTRFLYIMFCVSLLVVLALELTIAVIAFQNDTETRRNQTKVLMEEQLKRNGSAVYFKGIEEHFQCCGILGTERKCTLRNSKTLALSGCASKVNDYLDGVCCRTEYLAITLAFLQLMECFCVMGIIFALSK